MAANPMTQELPNPRYERKFVVPALSLAQVLAMVRQHPALFREVYPPRDVNNIYLDLPGFRDYRDHVSGAANRVKTRIRWYGPLSGPVERPQLERKLKRGLVGGKLTYALPGFTVNGCVPRRELVSALAGAELPEVLRAAMRQMQPALVNRYHRHYFLSADGCFRLTVDTQVRFYSPTAGNEWRTPFLNRSLASIIELKFDPRHADRAFSIAEALPFRLARCSKYVMGLESVGLIH